MCGKPMLSEEFVFVLLQASITGAGLVLAIYTLIIPLSRKYFGYRAKDIREEIQELKGKIQKTNTSISQGDLSELRGMLDSIETLRGFPTYLSWTAGATFFLYLGSTLMSLWWILDWNKETFDNWLPYAFGFATFLFIGIGLYSIKDISNTMKREFEELKRESENIKHNQKN